MCIAMTGPPKERSGRQQSIDRNSGISAARGVDLVADEDIEEIDTTEYRQLVLHRQTVTDSAITVNHQDRGGRRNRRSVYKNRASFKIGGRSKASKTRYLTRSELCGIAASLVLSFLMCLAAMYILHLSLPFMYNMIADLFGDTYRAVHSQREAVDPHVLF